MILERADLEKMEAKRLNDYAILSARSKGRKFEEEADVHRMCFQKDKERIIHCKAFRRLDEKTQVFIAGSGDHYRTRLTHTLEVAQISRDIARRLGLNEDLAEAIALAHDLGHPPFGHAGEHALDKLMRENGSHFEHNEQSQRVVEFLERAYPGFDGLNLSIEVLEGMIKHQTAWDQAGKKFEIAAHLEAQIVNISDEIAYTNHDIDDGLRSGILKLPDLEQFELWQMALEAVLKKYGGNLEEDVLISRTVSRIIAMMIEDLCEQTQKNIEKFEINSVEKVREHQKALAHFSDEMRLKIDNLRRFLYENFYLGVEVQEFIGKGVKMLEELFHYYMKNPAELSEKRLLSEGEIVEKVKDYIAGMTDKFLINEYKRLILGS